MDKTDCEKLVTENKHLRELLEKNDIIIKQHELITKLWQVVRECPYCKENYQKSKRDSTT